MQCAGNKAIVFCIFQAYNRLSMHQVIFIVVRSSDRGDSVENLYPRILTSLPHNMKIEKSDWHLFENKRMRLRFVVELFSTESPRSDDRTTIKIT